jgi:hypothetical protein
MQTSGHSDTSQRSRSRLSCMCHTGAPRSPNGHSAISASFSSSVPSMTSGMTAHVVQCSSHGLAPA